MRARPGLALPLHQPGRCPAARRSVEQLAGRGVWEEFPAAVGGPFQVAYERVAATGEPASFEACFEPLTTWLQVDAFRTDAGLVVTYEDVTGRRRSEQARLEAVAAREEEAERAAQAAREAELAGRHLMMLGDISQAMASTLDAERAAQRFDEERERLAAAVADLAGEPLERLCDGLLARNWPTGPRTTSPCSRCGPTRWTARAAAGPRSVPARWPWPVRA